ncbi:MAG TPA: hypothetical protein VK878_23130 [Candidatus Deferrimicrobiaceae bacterium]|nr:hypothetical protein [Candidatus Deferrimicrobiaceae bacterium]
MEPYRWRPLIVALALAGCAAPLLLKRGIYYQGDVTIVVVSREQVHDLCSVLRGALPSDQVIRGCWIPASRTVITEPDPAVLAHELQHARGERPMD